MPDFPDPSRRLVLLGASNLTRGLATALETAKRHWREPLDVLAATGNGRSYGLYARLLGRGLRGIVNCGLWRHLSERPRLPTLALLTDVGNDVMYGASADQILAWVETCLQRLGEHDAQLVVTGLPLVNLAGLGPKRFYAFRTLFFPKNRATLAHVTSVSCAVDDGLRRLSEKHSATFVEPRSPWYGLDPIHVRRSHWGAAWHEILSGWRPAIADDDAQASRVSIWYWLQSQLWAPEERWMLGMARRRRQPSIAQTDGTRISLF